MTGSPTRRSSPTEDTRFNSARISGSFPEGDLTDSVYPLRNLPVASHAAYTLSFPNLIFALTLFPNIEFFPFLSTNNQPISFLVIAGLWLVTTNGEVSLKGFVGFYLSLLLIVSSYAILTSLFTEPLGHPFQYLAHATGFAAYTASEFEILLTFASYLVGPTIFLYLIYNFRRVDPWVILSFIVLQLVVCLWQMFGSSEMQSFLKAMLDPIFVGFSERGYEFGRGVAGTFPEPSHLGRYLVVAFGLLFAHHYRGQLSTRAFVASVLALCILIALNRSITSVALMVGWLLLQLGMLYFSGRLIQGIAMTIGLALVVYLVALVPESNRIGLAIPKISSIYEAFPDLTILDLQIIGGFRPVGMVAGYLSVTLFPFGQGLGSYLHNFPETAQMLGIDVFSTGYYRNVVAEIGRDNIITKPNGYGAQLAYDMGVIGLSLLVLLSVLVLRSALANLAGGRAIWGLPIIGLFLILFYTTTTFPVPWILLAFMAFYSCTPVASGVHNDGSLDVPRDSHDAPA